MSGRAQIANGVKHDSQGGVKVAATTQQHYEENARLNRVLVDLVLDDDVLKSATRTEYGKVSLVVTSEARVTCS